MQSYPELLPAWTRLCSPLPGLAAIPPMRLWMTSHRVPDSRPVLPQEMRAQPGPGLTPEPNRASAPRLRLGSLPPPATELMPPLIRQLALLREPVLAKLLPRGALLVLTLLPEPDSRPPAAPGSPALHPQAPSK